MRKGELDRLELLEARLDALEAGGDRASQMAAVHRQRPVLALPPRHTSSVPAQRRADAGEAPRNCVGCMRLGSVVVGLLRRPPVPPALRLADAEALT